LSRALSLAAVTLLIGCFATSQARAQAQNLEAGKSPSQIFAGTCNACHKSPRGLLKTVPAGSLSSFLRQHYTTSPDMASLLSGFLISNGATDTRYSGGQAKDGKDAKQEAKPSGPPDQLDRFGHRQRPAPQEAARPDADGQSAQGELGRQGRNAKRVARPGEAPAADGQTPAQATNERGPDSRKLSAKQKLSKRGKPDSEEQPKSEAAKSEAAKTEAGKEEPKSETAKVDNGKPENSGPSGEAKSESAKIETPKEGGGGETPVLRADPVPPVTPAPPASSPNVSAAVSSLPPGPAVTPVAPPPASPAVAVAAPPPVAPAGPPAPPISQ
jgi:hypothetical protein